MPCTLSIRSYIGTPSTTYRNPSSTPRACINPLSSVAHPGVVAIASCKPRLLMRIGARLTASPRERGSRRGRDGLIRFGRHVDLFGERGRQLQLERDRQRVGDGQCLHHGLERRRFGFQRVAADRDVRQSELRRWWP